jgi:hypothetical protein
MTRTKVPPLFSGFRESRASHRLPQCFVFFPQAGKLPVPRSSVSREGRQSPPGPLPGPVVSGDAVYSR